ncbi:hypothetical protein C8Q76DRAFT_743755 [Earliella scabrosa]|nr:hypothetical protein C8Q76DRAFT_743755 [Earliella scabrosa]
MDKAQPNTSPKRPAPCAPPQPASPAKRAKAANTQTSASSPSDVWDKDFCDEDGNVVIRLGRTLFKQYKARLAKYCGYFEELFAMGVSTETIDGCPVYRVPPELLLKEFRDLLTALEPLEHVSNPPDQTLAISLLFAANTLSCPVVLALAKKRLCEIWDANAVPDASDVRPYTSAAYVVQLGRQFQIHGVLKRAFYELVSSSEFWEVLFENREQIRLNEADVLRLVETRVALGKMWREFVLEVPTKKELWQGRRGYSYGCCHPGGREWAKALRERGTLEGGALDPLRVCPVEIKPDGPLDGLDVVADASGLCKACLKEWQAQWQAKRVEWWPMLDALLKL